MRILNGIKWMCLFTVISGVANAILGMRIGATFFNASQTCIEIRLRQLNLLVDKRKASNKFTLSCDIDKLFS